MVFEVSKKSVRIAKTVPEFAQTVSGSYEIRQLEPPLEGFGFRDQRRSRGSLLAGNEFAKGKKLLERKGTERPPPGWRSETQGIFGILQGGGRRA